MLFRMPNADCLIPVTGRRAAELRIGEGHIHSMKQTSTRIVRRATLRGIVALASLATLACGGAKAAVPDSLVSKSDAFVPRLAAHRIGTEDRVIVRFYGSRTPSQE